MSIPKTKKTKAEDLEAVRSDKDDAGNVGEMNKEEALDSFDRGFQEMLDGETRPALEFLDELDNK